MKLRRNEVARYLGYRNNPLSGEVEALIAACEKELSETAEPRMLARRFAREALDFSSADLNRHLRGTEEVWLLALTIGSETDRLLRIWSVESMAKAAVGQACCAVMMDQLLDDYMQELKMKSGEGMGLLPAFSPGYGDFSLEDQEKVLRLLDARRRIGVFLTAGGMLVPEKTITAVIGITDRPHEACKASCLSCGKKDCAFRKESFDGNS